MNRTNDVPHPGALIKTEVIPQGMSVTKAAQLIGVGRPALSNLLNGKASLSTNMAMRLEKAFNYLRSDLMEMQVQYDAAQANYTNAPASSMAYVPPFLTIKANDIEGWAAHNISARSRLSVLLRMLVHSTGIDLTKVDFPGNDNAERPGWDGLIEANAGTPWIPAGRSGWEFGTSGNVTQKANRDFNKSVKAVVDENERSQTTFVFVTPRGWPQKDAWLKNKREQGLWKDVHAYEASDLEQWLEQSLPAQAWFANETKIPAQDVRSLDKCWADWANVSTPPLTGVLFSSAIEAAKRTMLSRLTKPSDGPTVIAADSTEEALAFVSQILGEHGGEELACYRNRVLVFDKQGVLPRLAERAQTIIPVVSTREVERELAPYANSIHSIVVCPRNTTNTTPHIILEPLPWETFNTALEEMGKDRDEISRLKSASGRSLTVLRRQLATVSAVRTPEWAIDRQTVAGLMPFLFVGTWDSVNETDKAGLSLLAEDLLYPELEKECQRLAQLNDAPVWSIGTYRGVISKIDLLYAIANSITPDDLRRYFEVARYVLGEDDPALDLAEDQRWTAAIYGKTREFSSAFREGISESLVLLAVHGKGLFKDRLGIDTEIEAMNVVRALLPEPLTTRILEANERDLPTYAEAAPVEFLSIIERDLKSDEPAVLGILRTADTGVFGYSPSYIGLLSALEGLAWSQETLTRVTFILARLAQVEIHDKWVNKPAHSLESIFRAWMPQTAADHETRVTLIKRLVEKFPDVAWRLIMSQFGDRHQVGDYTHKPRWRTDGYGFGEPFSERGPIVEFVREMVEISLTRKEYSLSMLCDLVERLHDLTEADQSRVWVLIEDWAKDNVSDDEKAALREKIRVSTLSRRATRCLTKNATKGLAAAAKLAYTALEPLDLLNKHAWLFCENWVEESSDEIENSDIIDFNKRENRIQKLRINALREIHEQRDVGELLNFAHHGNASWVIGELLATKVLSEDELRTLLRFALELTLSKTEKILSYKNVVSGALYAITIVHKREAILQSIAEGLPELDVARLLMLAPFVKATWKLVDLLGEEARSKYWQKVLPNRVRDPEIKEGVERLMKVGRPRAAFWCIRYNPGKIDGHLLYRLLSEMALDGTEDTDQYTLDHYYVEKAFEHLNSSPELMLDQKAELEFTYLKILARPWSRRENYGIPNLERYVEAHPEVFIQAITWTYKRKDGAADPAEVHIQSGQVQNMAERGHELLRAIERIPGHNHLDELESQRLGKWITTVRQSCADLGRADVADQSIGKMLSHAPSDKDGLWPCEAVRNVLEEIQSEQIMRGMQSGVYNSRGVQWRGEGGDQERELVEKYSKWGLEIQSTHPFVASRLLMALAKAYNLEAQEQDTAAGINRRLR